MRAFAHLGSGIILALLAASCTLGTGTRVAVKRPATAANSAAAQTAHSSSVVIPIQSVDSKLSVQSSTASGAATPATSGLTDVRRDALLAALADSVAASRASKITSTIGDVSGVLSNNGSSLISDNGGSLISDNGGSLVSDNGGSLTSKTKYALMAVTPAATSAVATAVESGFTPEHFVSEASELVYVVDALTPTTGGFKAYDKAGYHSLPPDRLLEALVDDFLWDDVVIQNPYNGDPSVLAMEYHLLKNSSKRIPFADRLLSRQIMRMQMVGQGFIAIPIGWEIEFALDVALQGGTAEHATFKAVAGEHDLQLVATSTGGGLSLPTHLVMTGQNGDGTYAGTIDSQGKIHIQVTHTTPAGVQTVLVIDTELDGSGHQSVTVPSAHLTVDLDLDAKGGGSGRLNDTTGSTPIKLGDITWDTAGVATIALPGGKSLTSQLF